MERGDAFKQPVLPEHASRCRSPQGKGWALALPCYGTVRSSGATSAASEQSVTSALSHSTAQRWETPSPSSLPHQEKSKEDRGAWKHPSHEIIFGLWSPLKLISASLILLTVHRDNLSVRSRNAGPGWQPWLGLWLAFRKILPVRRAAFLLSFFHAGATETAPLAARHSASSDRQTPSRLLRVEPSR